MLFRALALDLIFKDLVYENDGGFEAWRRRAEAATETLIGHVTRKAETMVASSLPVDSKLYGALKTCLCDYFFGKCAYCESDYTAVAWGDVEHYRPKRAVTEEKTHPGYYWLAYAPENLLPSCQLCNQGKGKRNHFPILGRRAVKPKDDLKDELPLLLNPYEEEDCGERQSHFKYLFEKDNWRLFPTGRIDGISVRGRVSIEVYGLNRTPLVNARRKSQLHAIRDLDLALSDRSSFDGMWKTLMSPTNEHASAVRAACSEWYSLLLERFQTATAHSA
jgi:hypothetical protein